MTAAAAAAAAAAATNSDGQLGEVEGRQ